MPCRVSLYAKLTVLPTVHHIDYISRDLTEIDFCARACVSSLLLNSDLQADSWKIVSAADDKTLKVSATRPHILTFFITVSSWL